MSDESRNAGVKRTAAELTERWPHLFDKSKPVPLAIGIDAALAAAVPDTPHAYIRGVLQHWCSTPRYLKALQAGAERQGLDGAAGVVTEEQSAIARQRWEGLQEHFHTKIEAKKKNVAEAEAAKLAKVEKLKAAEEKKAKQQQAATPAPTEPPATPKPTLAAKPSKPAPVVIIKKKRSIMIPPE